MAERTKWIVSINSTTTTTKATQIWLKSNGIITIENKERKKYSHEIEIHVFGKCFTFSVYSVVNKLFEWKLDVIPFWWIYDGMWVYSAITWIITMIWRELNQKWYEQIGRHSQSHKHTWNVGLLECQKCVCCGWVGGKHKNHIDSETISLNYRNETRSARIKGHYFESNR